MRTMLFVDYQNAYRSAREAFGWTSEAGVFGNLRPYRFGRQAVREPGRTLEQVRVYTGIHTPHNNAAQHAQMQRRIAAWIAEKPDKVEVFPRSLRYGRRGAEEKGVDVEIAIDIVSLAMDDAYDVLVLASADTDLVPALQLVRNRFPDKKLVTLGFDPTSDVSGDLPPAPLDLPNGGVDRVLITRRDFDRMSDRRNFYESTSDFTGQVDPKRWQQVMGRLDEKRPKRT